MKKWKFDSVFFYLIRNFLILVIVAFVLFEVVLDQADTYLFNKMLNSKAFDVDAQLSVLQEENYEALKYSGVKGKSYIEVLDETGSLIYTDNEKVGTSYTTELLSYIPNYNEGAYIITNYVKAEEDDYNIVIEMYRAYENESIYLDDYFMDTLIVLDPEQNVVFSSKEIEDLQLDDTKLEYLSGFTNDGNQIQKFEYTTTDGENRYLILHLDESATSPYSRYDLVTNLVLSALVGVFVLVLAITAFRMNLQIVVPLRKLGKAMEDYESGKEAQQGLLKETPKFREFRTIYENFVSMTGRLEKSEKERRSLEEDRQKMLADISHDLKTPITVIQGYSKAIADGIVSEEQQEKYLHAIEKKSERLSDLINSFYEYSKLEHPEYHLTKKKGNIVEYLREYLAAKYEEIDLAGFELEINLPECPIITEYDDKELVRVFENIISNSLKHNEKGTEIYVSMGTQEKRVWICLGDNGKGIPEDLKENVFKPFAVGDESRTTKEGSGLGMAIAKRIVEAHGGFIELVESKNPKYRTLYKIILPIS